MLLIYFCMFWVFVVMAVLGVCLSVVLVEFFFFVQVTFLLVEEFTLLRIHSSIESEASHLCLVFDAAASISGLLLVCYSLVPSVLVRNLEQVSPGRVDYSWL